MGMWALRNLVECELTYLGNDGVDLPEVSPLPLFDTIEGATANIRYGIWSHFHL